MENIDRKLKGRQGYPYEQASKKQYVTRGNAVRLTLNAVFISY